MGKRMARRGRLFTSCTLAEVEMVRAAATAQGLSMAEFIRRVVIRAAALALGVEP
jgi:uncharacterized protein (DUF1778 family)